MCLALRVPAHEKRTRWLVAVMATLGAIWGCEDVGDNWLLGPNGLIATLTALAEFVVIPYLVVVLTGRRRRRDLDELPPDRVASLTA